ncbi:MAG: hypothetical protein V7K27_07690 [Nostoc sp.]|uniref:hypothetical protein n=1 Tax=Nostoc sp. TaxID=1180 RepID=UPI002FF47965
MITEVEALQKSQELWNRKWRVYEIHRYLLNNQLERSLVDKVVLEVTGVDFCGDNSYSY